MSFPKYPKYKDSGVEWLGEVPEHWDTQKLRRLFDIKKRIASELGYDVFSITQNGIRVKDVENNEGQQSMDYSKYQIVDAGDFAMNPMDLITGGVDIAKYTGVTSPDYRVCALRAPTEYCPQFLLYLLQSIYRQKIFYAYGQGSSQLGRWRLPRQQFNNFTFPIPSKGEQTKIVALLDRETSKIDGLVGEQCQLIELLKEKRQAVISHAVTKGLNPNAPLKPSCIEWLGDVPEQWEVIQMKRVASIRYGIGEPPKYHDEGTPLVRATNVHAGRLFAEGMVFVNPGEIPEQRIVWLAPGDIIVVRSGAYTGDSAIIPVGFGPCIAGFDMVLKCHSAQSEFIQFALLSSYLKEGQIDLEKMRAAQPHLNAEELGACFLVLPDRDEQTEIVAYLTEQTARLDALIAEAERGIDLLQERRTALISAAVTGKIDLR